jgi:tRNA threonylcarbamoyladenosine biosynthesis protein TsaE
MIELLLRSPDATRKLGRKLGAALEAFDFIALRGELGAGKTLLVRGAVEGAGALDAASSPTFALINVYRGGRVTLQHIDLYRLSGAAELFALGFDDLLKEPAATLCEWAEKAQPALPSDRLDIEMEYAGPKSRRARLAATGPRSERLLAAIRAN